MKYDQAVVSTIEILFQVGREINCKHLHQNFNNNKKNKNKIK